MDGPLLKLPKMFLLGSSLTFSLKEDPANV